MTQKKKALMSALSELDSLWSDANQCFDTKPPVALNIGEGCRTITAIPATTQTRGFGE